MHMIILAAVIAVCTGAGFGLGWVWGLDPINNLILGYLGGVLGIVGFIVIVYLLSKSAEEKDAEEYEYSSWPKEGD